MTAIWQNDSSGWRLLAPTDFPDEATLHTLVAQAPQILPLAGSPRLVVIAREALLGNGYADLLAIEPSGRLAIIEVKLARNAEARRAVVAQVLTYAAYLKGFSPSALEHGVLARHLQAQGYESLAAAIENNDQAGTFDQTAFSNGLAESLAEGRFRLVFVLDTVPQELVRLVGYLETITDKLLIDLITVSAYTINDTQVLVPQRIEPERYLAESSVASSPPSTVNKLVEGASDFAATIDAAPEEHQSALRRLCNWAIALQQEGLVQLSTYHGKDRWTLLPRLSTDNVGLVTIWNDHGAYLQLWRSVFERRAPGTLPRIEHLISPSRLGQGTVIRSFNDEVLEAITDAYREAAVGRISEENSSG